MSEKNKTTSPPTPLRSFDDLDVGLTLANMFLELHRCNLNLSTQQCYRLSIISTPEQTA